jgi:hypothetical protein
MQPFWLTFVKHKNQLERLFYFYLLRDGKEMNMNIIKSENREQKIKEVQKKLTEIHYLFSEGRIDEKTYLREEKELLDSLEMLFVMKNMESILNQ